MVCGAGICTGGGGTATPVSGIRPAVDLPVAVAPVASGAPALKLRLRRPARTPAPAASRRKVPGRCRAKDFTSVRSEPGSRPSSQDATAEDRSAAWRTRSVATPGWSEAAAMECNSPATDRRPSATFCCWVPACSVRSDFAWCSRSRALVLTSAATLAASALAVPATFWAASAACRVTSAASSLAASCLESARPVPCGGTTPTPAYRSGEASGAAWAHGFCVIVALFQEWSAWDRD